MMEADRQSPTDLDPYRASSPRKEMGNNSNLAKGSKVAAAGQGLAPQQGRQSSSESDSSCKHDSMKQPFAQQQPIEKKPTAMDHLLATVKDGLTLDDVSSSDEGPFLPINPEVKEAIKSQLTARFQQLEDRNPVFQFCGAQFGAQHDIDVHKEAIVAFFEAASELGLTPTFELRQYNTLAPNGQQSTEAQFKNNLLALINQAAQSEAVGGNSLAVTLKTNRDESLEPSSAQAPNHQAWVSQLVENLEGLLKNPDYKEPLDVCPLGLTKRGDTRTEVEKNPVTSFITGKLAIPADAAEKLSHLKAKKLKSIYTQGGDKALRFLAYLQHKHDILPKYKAAAPPELTRSNSTDPVDLVVTTNLVNGKDDASVALTAKIVTNSAIKNDDAQSKPIFIIGIEARKKDYSLEADAQDFHSVFQSKFPKIAFTPIKTSTNPQISEQDATQERTSDQPNVQPMLTAMFRVTSDVTSQAAAAQADMRHHS